MNISKPNMEELAELLEAPELAETYAFCPGLDWRDEAYTE